MIARLYNAKILYFRLAKIRYFVISRPARLYNGTKSIAGYKIIIEVMLSYIIQRTTYNPAVFNLEQLKNKNDTLQIS